MTGKVKVLFISVVMYFFCQEVFAQSHFIFIQSENKQPFSVLLNNRNYGSSGTGYVIIPQLNSGDHFLNIKSAADQKDLGVFKIKIAYNDLGFNLKEEQGAWMLENVQSKSITKIWIPEAAEEKKKGTAGNGFGDMLSQVVSDPKLTQKKEVVKTETADTGNTQIITETKTSDSAVAEEVVDINTSGVIKNSEDETKEGMKMVFVDFNQKRSDTVSIVIPMEGSVETDRTGKSISGASNITEEKPTSTAIDSLNKEETRTATNIETQKKAEAKTQDKIVEVAKDSVTVPVISGGGVDSVSNPFHKNRLTIDSAKAEKLNTEEQKPAVDPTVNPNCKGIATNDDFIKLRRKMAGQDGEEEMTDAAKKAFKLKCYTTEQIKNLGSLFLNDQSRYAFFDAAYTYVFDPGNYATLESQLIDDYYKKRFKAMLH